MRDAADTVVVGVDYSICLVVLDLLVKSLPDSVGCRLVDSVSLLLSLWLCLCLFEQSRFEERI